MFRVDVHPCRVHVLQAEVPGMQLVLRMRGAKDATVDLTMVVKEAATGILRARTNSLSTGDALGYGGMVSTVLVVSLSNSGTIIVCLL